MVVLHVPRVVPVLLLLGGGVWTVVAATGLMRRIGAVAGTDGAVLGGVSGITSSGISLLLGIVAVAAGLRWLAYRVTVDADGIAVRSLLRRRRHLPLPDVKGVVLRQSGSIPQLRIVMRNGDVLVLPGWSLLARHPDGEVEPAGPALQRLGAELGIRVKLLTLLGDADRRRG